MNKRKSVSRVTEKDTQAATKYVLTHQTVDTEGDLETNLVKVCVVLMQQLFASCGILRVGDSDSYER